MNKRSSVCSFSDQTSSSVTTGTVWGSDDSSDLSQCLAHSRHSKGLRWINSSTLKSQGKKCQVAERGFQFRQNHPGAVSSSALPALLLHKVPPRVLAHDKATVAGPSMAPHHPHLWGFMPLATHNPSLNVGWTLEFTFLLLVLVCLCCFYFLLLLFLIYITWVDFMLQIWKCRFSTSSSPSSSLSPSLSFFLDCYSSKMEYGRSVGCYFRE